MLADSSQSAWAGRLDKEIHLPSTARIEIVYFIAQELPRWRDHPERKAVLGENKLTSQLCEHLSSAATYSPVWSHLQFRTEIADETNSGRSIDLAPKPRATTFIIEGRRHCQFDAIFPIECKRLPTPKEKGRDEREYVITESGTTGGIQRFKLGHHGASHKFAAMIAYIQERSFSDWVNQVNTWIHELSMVSDSIWSDSDVLSTHDNGPVAEVCMLYSTHVRPMDLGECEIRHMWINMN